ncbi:MAG: ABC transporter permease, partial [Acidobacteria bacterium]|nr:ABC transporter permease [Acidobacteriota bacterium]
SLGSLIAWRGLGGGPYGGLRDGARAAGDRPSLRLRKGLVVTQLAVSVVLLTASGLLVKSLLNLERVDAGFEESNVLKARLDLDWSRYDTGEERARFYRSLLEEVAALPGVEGVTLSSRVPLDEGLYSGSLILEGEAPPPDEVRPQIGISIVGPRFFETLRVPMIDGRSLALNDDAKGTPVAVVSRSLAHRFWQGRSPVGRRISLDGGESWLDVVGVAGDVKQERLDADSEDELYLPVLQRPNLSSRILVRTAGPPLGLADAVRRVVQSIDPEQPVTDFASLASVRHASVAAPRQTVTLVGVFALLALVISATGMAGLLAFSVSQRVREIGVRIALGASRGSVLRMVLSQGLALVSGGTLLGIAGGALVSRALRGLLFQVAPNDPATLGTVAAMLLATAALACWAPAWRATHIEPMTALRND